jgi:hypothetical protein
MDMANKLRNILIIFTYFSTFFALQGWAGLCADRVTDNTAAVRRTAGFADAG